MRKTLVSKLNKIKNHNYKSKDFIIADAKDGDMGGGIYVVGCNKKNPNKARPFTDYLQEMKDVTKSKMVDIMLMSASSAEQLVTEGVFENSSVTPAVRFNDATDIWSQRHANYKNNFPQNFRTLKINSVKNFVNLGLFSITFTNNLKNDLKFISGFNKFVEDLSSTEMSYFLEIFNPQVDIGIDETKIPQFVNDCIVRCLAGLTEKERPLFLKMPFNGANAMEEICSYNPERLIVGILGGSKGTTRDTFELIFQGEKYGARVALFGRKIQFSEAPLKTIELMRKVVEKDVTAIDAVKIYHSFLKENSIKPLRKLEDDLIITDNTLI